MDIKALPDEHKLFFWYCQQGPGRSVARLAAQLMSEGYAWPDMMAVLLEIHDNYAWKRRAADYDRLEATGGVKPVGFYEGKHGEMRFTPLQGGGEPLQLVHKHQWEYLPHGENLYRVCECGESYELLMSKLWKRWQRIGEAS